MTNFLPTPGTNDYYTALINAGILSGVSNPFTGPYSGATAYSIDPTVANGITVIRLNTSAATQFTFSFPSTFTTPGLMYDGYRLRLVVNQGAWSNTFTWPSSFWPAKGILPAKTPPVAGAWTIELRWDASLGAWQEIGHRSFTPSATQLTGDWTNMTLTVGTANGAWATPAYRIDPYGYVHWRGLLFLPASVQAANTVLFTMPTGFRVPTGTGVSTALKVGRITTATPNEGSAFLITDNTGAVKLRSASVASDILVLESVIYSVDA